MSDVVVYRSGGSNSFESLDDFIAFLKTRVAAVEAAKARGLDAAGRIIATEAKAEIGVPQDEAGPFWAWEPLSSATLEGFEHPKAGYIPGKIELGYVDQRSAEDPLLRTGALEASIGHSVDGTKRVVVGSTSQIAVYQELGTPDALYPIQPRSFLGGALYRKGEEAVRAIAHEVLTALTGVRRNTWT